MGGKSAARGDGKRQVFGSGLCIAPQAVADDGMMQIRAPRQREPL